jgi:hypothetical protein
MTRYTFVNTNTILLKFSSFQNFSESSFKTVKQHSFQIMLYNSNWYGGQYQDIQTALGSWYGPVEMFRTTTQGQSVYPDIALYISNYCVYCIEVQNVTHTI